MEHDQRYDILVRHVTMLREHFDCVQVVASCENPDPEQSVARFEVGRGSWFERYGLMRCWVVRADEGERLRERAERDEPDEPVG